MTVEELIKELGNFPKDMEVVLDYDDGYSTGAIFEVEIGNKYHNEDYKKVVILY